MAEITTIILIKSNAMDTSNLMDYYIKPLEERGIDRQQISVKKLIYNNPKKVTAKVGHAWLEKLLQEIPETVTQLVVADSNYYKWLSKTTKISSQYGVRSKAKFTGYTKFDIVYVPNYNSLFKQPENIDLITVGLDALAEEESKKIIHSAEYAFSYGTEKELLDQLYQYPALTVDLESYGLDWDAEVATIAFAWDKHNGICIDVRETGFYYVKKFLTTYRGVLIMHNALFDAKLLISNWWMEHETDYQGMQEGLGVFANVQDSMLTTYLAKNATTAVSLDLKTNALPYLGQFAIDVTDISKHDQKTLMEYNIYDVLGTWYVWELYVDQADTEAYKTIFQPSIKPILKMMLVGLPLAVHTVEENNKTLTAKEDTLRKLIAINPIVQTANKYFRQQECEKANAKLKTKVRPLSDFDYVEFNPNSNTQLSYVLYEQLELPVIDTTKSGNPSTSADTLKDLKNHTKDSDVIELIDNILALTDVVKINGTFIKALIDANGSWLHGNLKLGGAQSGRLSCVHKDTQVLTEKGYLRIVDIPIGTNVLTHKGNWKPITKHIYKGVDEMFEVKFSTGEVLLCTSAHKVLTSDGSFTTIGELNECIKNVDNRLKQHKYMFKTLPTIRPANDGTTYSGKIGDYTSQCIGSIETKYPCRSIESYESSEVLGIQIGDKKSYEREDRIPTSQLEGGMLGYQRIPNNDVQRETSICAQSSNDGDAGIVGITPINASPPYRRRPTQQQHRQSSTMYQRWSQGYSLSKSRDTRCYIEEINSIGSHEVYDITVEDDHSYYAGGVFSHNSNAPNLQNLPSHGPMGKLIKSCFVAPENYLWAGADFASLEERIGAILSNDPNRIKVYTDGFDGHSMRAAKYFRDQMPEISAKLDKLDVPGKFYKVTSDDGSVEYYHEDDLPN